VLAMWLHFDEFDRERSFLAWAMKFAKLTAMNSLRSKRRGRVIFSEPLLVSMADSLLVEEDDTGSLDSYRDALARCVDRLAMPDRDLLRLCYYEKCSIKSVADRLGRAPQSICNSLRRIRGVLFDCIQQSADPEDRP
jgi:RNA polymerase sigma-70 factor, ECF subfamily